MTTVEYRVRPVERFVVTKFQPDGGCSVIGEYPNGQLATTVKEAFDRAEGRTGIPYPDFPQSSSLDSPRKFVVVASGFDVQTMAFYAYGQENAEAVRTFAEQRFGGEWDIFEKA